MQINNKGIALFVKRCNEVIDGKYLLAEKNISNLMKAIAQNEGICQAIKECLEGFDFEKEFENSKVAQDKYSQEKMLLVLPSEDSKIISYVFCLLWKFDDKSMNFNDFLQNCFQKTKSFSESYSIFVEELIKPFKKTMLSYLDILSSSEECSENNVMLEKFFCGQRVEFGIFVVDEIVSMVNSLIAKITNEPKLRFRDKQDMVLLAEGLSNAVVSKDKKLIKLLWTGFFHSVKDYEGCLDDVYEIERMLKKYFVL